MLDQDAGPPAKRHHMLGLSTLAFSACARTPLQAPGPDGAGKASR